MKSRRIYIFLILLTLLAICIGIDIGRNYKIYSQGEDMLQCRNSDFLSYTKDVFINGEKINNELSVVVYKGDIYFSINMLRNCISNNFISQQGSGVLIRRNKIESCALLQSEYEMYIELDALRQYVHVNNDVYKFCGNIYMDCMLPASVNYNGKKYYLTNEKISSFSEKNNLTNEILNDGRMAWVDGSDLYVEDDWENVYRYEKEKTTIS